MAVTSVVGEAALPAAPPPAPPVVAKTPPPEGEPAAELELCSPAAEEAVALALALAAAVVPAAEPPALPAVAVGRAPAPSVCPLGTQLVPEMDAKEGEAPVSSFSSLGPGSGYSGSVLDVDLQELMSARLPTKSSG